MLLRGILLLRTKAIAAVETTNVYDNRRHGFAYKTGAAVRVRSEDDGGVELVVPLMIGCKAPQRFNAPDSCRDEMRSKSDMVFMYDVPDDDPHAVRGQFQHP